MFMTELQALSDSSEVPKRIEQKILSLAVKYGGAGLLKAEGRHLLKKGMTRE